MSRYKDRPFATMTVCMPYEVKDAIKHKAADEDTTLSWIVNEAIFQYLGIIPDDLLGERPAKTKTERTRSHELRMVNCKKEVFQFVPTHTIVSIPEMETALVLYTRKEIRKCADELVEEGWLAQEKAGLGGRIHYRATTKKALWQADQ